MSMQVIFVIKKKENCSVFLIEWKWISTDDITKIIAAYKSMRKKKKKDIGMVSMALEWEWNETKRGKKNGTNDV